MANGSSDLKIREAVRHVLEGHDPEVTATFHGLQRSELEQALIAFQKGGWAALQTADAGHRSRRKLTPEQEDAIHHTVRTQLPPELELPHPLWNREALLALIEQRTGLRLPERTITTYMERWGFLPEKPVRTAFRKQPGAVREWMRRDFPVVAMQARALGGEVFWLGWKPLLATGRPSQNSRKGSTLHAPAWSEGTHLIFMTHNRGHVHWMVLERAVGTHDIALFLDRALHARGRSLMIIVPSDPLLGNDPSSFATQPGRHPQLRIYQLPVPR